ncbi:MAG: MATE family efflux transporter [Bacteroidaceae bacterium]|nr:MATE family efflux transporter [Bacteroidaceae bacterium]
MNAIERYSKHYSTIIRLGTPIVLGQLGNVILGFIDTIMVGQYSGAALSAAGFVNNIFNLGIFAMLGFSYGATPIIGAFYGRKEDDNVGHSFRDSVWANIIFGTIIIMAYSLLYINIGNLNQPEELLPLMRPYFLTLLASLPFVILLNSFKQFTDSVAATKTAMWVIIVGNVTNIVLNYMLIFGTCGFSEMGLTGAGIATMLSRVLMAVLFVLIIAKQRRFSNYKTGFKAHRSKRKDVTKMFKVGTPLAVQMGMETASFSLASLLMGWIGAVELAAFQVMCTTGSLCFLVYYGIAAAACIRISHYRGRGEWEQVKETATASLHIILFVATILSAGIIIFKCQLAAIFTSDTNIQNMFIALLIPMLAYQVSDGIQINYANALRGIAVTKPMSIYAIISYILLALPVSYILGFIFEMGGIGVAYGLPVGLTSAAILYFMRFRKEINHKTK